MGSSSSASSEKRENVEGRTYTSTESKDNEKYGQNESCSNKINSRNVDINFQKSERSEQQATTERVQESADDVLKSRPSTSDNNAPQSNDVHVQKTDPRENKEKGTEDEKGKIVEENRQNDEKRKELKSSLKSRLQDLKFKYKDTEMCSGTVVRALDLSCDHYPCDPSYKGKVASSLREKEATLKSTRQQKAKLLNRLSELASVRLRHNNPDIADLSDENRATKLAERLSELYDNEWTDLYEATKKQNTKHNNVDRCIAEGLRDVLKFCYDECRRIVCDQRDRLCSCLKVNHTEDFQALPEGLQMRIKEFQKFFPQYSLPKIKTVISKKASEGLKRNMVVESSKKTKKHFDPYISLCIEITLHTQIQDPPLKLDFDSKDTDESSFRPYTSTGPQLEYVLWPALLLHEKGSVVAKGVAQFKARSEKKTEEQNTSENTANVTDSDWNTYSS